MTSLNISYLCVEERKRSKPNCSITYKDTNKHHYNATNVKIMFEHIGIAI